MNTIFSPQTWQLADWALVITLLVLVAWIAQTLFVYWRRRQTNLTPVDAPSVNREVEPDFLHVDKKARREALKKGDRFAKKLDREEKRASNSPASKWCNRFLGLTTVILAVVSIILFLVR